MATFTILKWSLLLLLAALLTSDLVACAPPIGDQTTSGTLNVARIIIATIIWIIILALIFTPCFALCIWWFCCYEKVSNGQMGFWIIIMYCL